MLSTDSALIYAVIVAFLAACLAILCWVNARKAANHAAECYSWVEKVGHMRDPTARIAELSTELTELHDAYDALLSSHKKLRSRIGMRENRAKKASDPDPEDLSSVTDKRQLRLAAKAAGLLK